MTTPLYPITPTIDPTRPVYKPDQQKGLLSDDQRNELIGSFAGGILNGYQVHNPSDPTTYGLLGGGWTSDAQPQNQGAGPNYGTPQMPNQIVPINPTGVYSTTPPEGGQPPAESPGSTDPQGAYNMHDVFSLQTALGGANWGTGNSHSAMDMFEDHGDGSYSLRTAPPEGVQWGFDPYAGVRGSPNLLLDEATDGEGQPLGKERTMNILRARAANVDNSK